MVLPTLLLQLSATISLAAATNLFVSDYSGNITTLSLTEHKGIYSLLPTSFNEACAPNPSWLTLDINHGTLYCLDEGLNTTNGSLTSFTISPGTGKLAKIHREETISGPVNGVIYGDAAEQRAIALAHYSGSAVSSWTLDANHTANFAFSQAITFSLSKAGPDAERQDAPHEHEAVLDPTGKFLVVPDLGADLIRVFSFDSKTNELVPQTPLQVTPGSGPRHVVFYQPYGVVGGKDGTSFMFLVSELANTVTSFAVSYPDKGGMRFKQVYKTTSYGDDLVVPAGNAVAEIAISVSQNTYPLLPPSKTNRTFFLLHSRITVSSSSQTETTPPSTSPTPRIPKTPLQSPRTLFLPSPYKKTEACNSHNYILQEACSRVIFR
jgi:6-phosphogluconolactonase (cycloisomerase 2 family)